MIRKLTHVLALCLGILVCSSAFNFEHPGAGTFAGGVVQPFAASPQYDVTESNVRRQLTVDERIQGTSSAPQGGAGLMWSSSF